MESRFVAAFVDEIEKVAEEQKDRPGWLRRHGRTLSGLGLLGGGTLLTALAISGKRPKIVEKMRKKWRRT